MQNVYVDDQHRDAASLVPEWPRAIEAQSDIAINDHPASGRPSIVRRMVRAFARFSVAVLIGACATLAWQSYGDNAIKMLSTQVPSLRWLSMSATNFSDAQRLAQNTAVPQSISVAQPASQVAAGAELAQLEPMARDLAAMRHSLEQLTDRQVQIMQNMATLQAAQQDIRQKISARALSQPLSDQSRKPPKPRPQAAQSPPVAPAPPVTQSPAQ
jgi:small-conductance mechanosensitive channel